LAFFFLSFETGSCYVVTILLPLPPKCCDYRHVPPHPLEDMPPPQPAWSSSDLGSQALSSWCSSALSIASVLGRPTQVPKDATDKVFVPEVTCACGLIQSPLCICLILVFCTKSLHASFCSSSQTSLYD
jgi:hypothetical protein